MVLGAFLADAAGMSLHWIYSQSEIAGLVGSGSPFFFNPPSCPFYDYQLGWGTPYGQQTQITLAVGAAGGAFDPVAYASAMYAEYKAGGPAARAGYYFDASTKEFVANMASGKTWPSCGGNDDQADAVAHVVPVVALYAGNTSRMLAAAETVIRVTQNTDNGVAFGLAAARVLEKIVAGGLGGAAAVAGAIADMRDPARASPQAQDGALAQRMEDATSAGALAQDYSAFVLSAGQSCDYPFQLSAVANLLARGAAYTNATALAILAGGDSGSRNMWAGAANAAILGDKAKLPADWAAKTSSYATIAPLAAKLVAQRPH